MMDDRVSIEELNALAGAELHQAADAMDARATREAGQPTEAGLRAAALLLRKRAQRLGHVPPVVVDVGDVGPEERARFEREVAQCPQPPIIRAEVPPLVFVAPLPLGAWERLRDAVEAHVDFLRRARKPEDADRLVADLGALAARLGPAATPGRVLLAGTKPARLLPEMVLRHAHHKLTLINESVDEHGLPCWWCRSNQPHQANAYWPTAWLEHDVLADNFVLPEEG